MKRTYILRIAGVFFLLYAVYLLIAYFVLAPQGYYGTLEAPRFADPWIARAETLLSGGKLYSDVFTAAPPIINFLMIPPTVVAGAAGHVNPWSTLSFMTYFSLFNLFTAIILLYMAEDEKEGFHNALYFLFNPLTFGNSILRRQDEPILVFFFALSMLFLVHNRRWRSLAAIGVTMLIKLSGSLMIPVAFLRTRDWRYLIVPVLIFGGVFAPFIISGGETAVSNVTQRGTQHPFRFRGISLGALWEKISGAQSSTVLTLYSIVLIICVLAVMWIIYRRPMGWFEDMALLTTAVLMLAPNLHNGYLLILVLMLTPLVRKYRLQSFYFLFAFLALVADMYKWPVENFEIAFGLMLGTFITMILAMVWVRKTQKTVDSALVL